VNSLDDYCVIVVNIACQNKIEPSREAFISPSRLVRSRYVKVNFISADDFQVTHFPKELFGCRAVKAFTSRKIFYQRYNPRAAEPANFSPLSLRQPMRYFGLTPREPGALKKRGTSAILICVMKQRHPYNAIRYRNANPWRRFEFKSLRNHEDVGARIPDSVRGEVRSSMNFQAGRMKADAIWAFYWNEDLYLTSVQFAT